MNISPAAQPLAVLWDFGGVILSSPFEAFAHYERAAGLPQDFIRSLNARNPDTNAWAKMERSEVSLKGFVDLFEEQLAAVGRPLHAVDVLTDRRVVERLAAADVDAHRLPVGTRIVRRPDLTVRQDGCLDSRPDGSPVH